MKILIVGAGVAGLATHKALRQHGIDASIVERSHKTGAGGAGLYLPGNSTRAAAQLGLLPALRGCAETVQLQQIHDETGRLLNTVTPQDFWKDIGPSLSLKRSVFWTLLRGDTEIRYRQAVGVENLPGHCKVTFDDGETCDYDLLVAADGVHSGMRKIAFPGAPNPEYVGYVAWRSIAKNTCGIDRWTAFLGRKRSVLAIPVSRSELYVYADQVTDAADVGNSSRFTRLEPLFGDFAGPLRNVLDSAPKESVHFGPIEGLRLTDWFRNRIVLVGDAAHATSPNMAEGGGMALEDALVLAEELSHAGDISVALSRYQARRQNRVAWVARQSALRDRMRHLPRPIRNAILRAGGAGLYHRAYRPLAEPI